MLKSVSELNTNLILSVYRNLQTAKRAISNVIEKIADSHLKRELKNQFKDYDSLSEDCEDLAKNYDIELCDSSFFTKMKMWINVNLATMFDKTNRKIASLNILGSTMGIIDLMGTLSDSKKCKRELITFTKKVLDLEQANIEKLKPYILQQATEFVDNENNEIKNKSHNQKTNYNRKNNSNKTRKKLSDKKQNNESSNQKLDSNLDKKIDKNMEEINKITSNENDSNN